eukprot:TRINITY_DN12358_c0_g1_i5.p1 TRINITY_DN12358_c0_g1~~TRINITY_DN12358_c0_g1_i5.p1  ORF type:complete len:368 (+),score=133.71 TRINITY_DN12358_c0_g1_i5:45-1106(+)
MDALQKANSLFVDENYAEALTHYNAAVEAEPKSGEAFLKRSLCHTKLNNFLDAVEDANKAIALDPNNGKAYLRKGIACFEMEEYETAFAAFTKASGLEPDNATIKTWIRKCQAELGEDAKTIPSSTPTPATPSAPAPTPAPTPTPTPTPIPTPTTAPSAPKIRHEWYQNNTHIYVSIFCKGTKKEDVDIKMEAEELSVSIKLSGGSDYVLDLDLCEAIVPGESSYEIMSTKIEVMLKKEKLLKWLSLERTAEKRGSQALDTVAAPPQPKKNWDKIVADNLGDEKVEGEAGLNKLFQDIFSGGSDEQKKAMIKSFTESGGTVLSTNWDEVGKGEVKPSPPKGMEAHTWSENQRA